MLSLIPVLITSLAAQAASFPKLTSYVETRVVTAEKSMQTVSWPRAQLQAVNVDFVAQAGFGLSEVFSVTLYPELDLVFTPASAAAIPPASEQPAQ